MSSRSINDDFRNVKDSRAMLQIMALQLSLIIIIYNCYIFIAKKRLFIVSDARTINVLSRSINDEFINVIEDSRCLEQRYQ
jgi:hypothetical protein